MTSDSSGATAPKATGTPAATSDDFAAFVAEQATAEPETTAEAPTKAAEAEPAEGDEPATDETGEAGDDAEETEVRSDDEQPDAESERISKQLAAINRAKRRAEAEVAKQRQALDAQRAEVAKLHEQYRDIAPKVAEFERLRARAAVDPVAALVALGIDEDSLEDVARQVYMASRSAPDHIKSEGAKLRRLREQESATEKTQREILELKQQLEQERAAVQQERIVTQFYQGVERAAEQHPLVAKMLTAEPDEAKAEISKIANALHKAGEKITPDRCAALFEARLQARLKALGIDAAPTKTQAKTGRETKPRSLGNDLSTSTRPRPATSTPDDEFAAFLEEARSGRLGAG